MKILHFRETFSLLSETFIYDSYLAQRQHGLDAQLATVHRVDAATRPVEGVHLLKLPFRFHPRRILAQLRGHAQRLPRWERPFPLYAQALRAAIEQLRPQVVHAHFSTAGVIAEVASRGLGVPLVVAMYGHDISRLPRERRWQARYARLFERAAAVTVLSRDMREVAARHGADPARIKVIHLSRRLESLPFRARTGSVRRWVSIGRFVEKKGFEDAIRAVARLRERHVAVELELLGDGPLQPAMVRLASDLGVAECVRFRGALPNSQAMKALQEADAFLLCSKTAANGDQEGTPTVLIEAQALGVPCVSTRHAGIPEMLPASAQWLLATEGSVDEIAARMEQLSALSEEARSGLALAGRAHIEREFSLDQQAALYADLYQRVAVRAR
jgi:glycosyltransferase involved in cell wall biosynthesis